MPFAPVSSSPRRSSHVGVLALTVVIFAVVVAVVTLRLRASLRDQIVRQQGETLAALALMQVENGADELKERGVALEQAPVALLIAVLKASKWPGVAAVRVFDSQRHFSSAWQLWEDTPPSDDDWRQVMAGRSVVRRHPHASVEEVVGIGSTRPGLLEVWVPLRPGAGAAAIGAAQFWLEENALGAELRAHDRRLWLQAAFAWLAGSAVITLALSWAFHRLDVANRELRARGEDLQRANRELVLAAKTSALGAVTAHLMHELKNPIAGLEILVAGQAESAARGESGGELAAASELTRRLRTMVNDVVGVLRDEQTSADYELTAADIVEVAAAKVQDAAKQCGVRFASEGDARVSISGRRANLAVLVIRNLLQNAIEASGAGGLVRLRGAAREAGGVEFLIEDSGGGLPPEVRARLFQPCASTKVGGSGLGLALSYQLAQQARGRLELVRSDAGGTCFRLVLQAEA